MLTYHHQDTLLRVSDRMYAVVIECFYGVTRRRRIEVSTLIFEDKDRSEQPVNSSTIYQFIEDALLYRPSIYPDLPGAVCYAVDAPIQYENGECHVSEIFYQDHLIYALPNTLTS